MDFPRKKKQCIQGHNFLCHLELRACRRAPRHVSAADKWLCRLFNIKRDTTSGFADCFITLPRGIQLLLLLLFVDLHVIHREMLENKLSKKNLNNANIKW
jgi:hypothetical protein